MTLSIGAKLGPHEIVAPLGAGGMGEVYRARDSRLGRDVAIKVLPAHLTRSAEFRARFEREAKSISQLTHPNICTLYDVGHHDEFDFLVMELLEGETLADRLTKGALPLEQMLKCGVEIASALDAAHRKGVIHRDLKPGNVMLTKGGAKLLDFGLAKSAGLAESDPSAVTVSQPLTTKGTILGTFQYMAPEQLEGAEADARTDIFAFGAVLYEMATGKRAFEGSSRASLIASIMSSQPRAISELQPMTPPALDHLVRCCLAKDRDDRIQTAHDVKLQLEWMVSAGSQAGAPLVTTVRRKRRQWLAWSAAALFATLAAFQALELFRNARIAPRVVRAFVPAPENSAFVSLGSGPGGAGPVAISPDGTQLAFVAKANGGTDRLHVRAVDSLIARPLPNTEGARYPFWSYDSKSIAYFTGGKLKKIDASGGPPVALCNAASGRGGTWNSDGLIVFTPDSDGPMHRVSASGGTSTPLTVMKEGEETHRWPFFLPDGQHFLYFIRAKGGGSFSEKNTLMLGSLEGTTHRQLMQVSSNAIYASGHVLFLRDGTLMAQPFDAARLELSGGAFPIAEQVLFDGGYTQGVFSASVNGVLVFQPGSSSAGSQLVWLDREGKELGVLGEPALYDTIRLSPDGKLAAVGITDGTLGKTSLWLLDVARGSRTRFTLTAAWDNNPVWSPDGNNLVFGSDRTGRMNLYQKSIGGVGNEEMILPPEISVLPSDWSQDGRWILLTDASPQQVKTDVRVVEAGGEKKPVAIAETPFNEYDARFSPDGRWIVLGSDETDAREVYVMPFPGPGRKWQISTAGGIHPLWRGDGKEIFYVSQEMKLMSVEVDAQGSSFEPGQPKALFQLLSLGPGELSLEATADGQKFLVARALESRSGSQLTLVVNWNAGLRKP